MEEVIKEKKKSGIKKFLENISVLFKDEQVDQLSDTEKEQYKKIKIVEESLKNGKDYKSNIDNSENFVQKVEVKPTKQKQIKTRKKEENEKSL